MAVAEGGKLLWKHGDYRDGVLGVTARGEEAEYVTFVTGSGTYSFLLHKK